MHARAEWGEKFAKLAIEKPALKALRRADKASSLRKSPVPEVAKHLVCSKCGARNSATYNPIWARPDARIGGIGRYPEFNDT